ncbi:MAG: hypothetical protein FI731_12740 [SAR202 cluster bacterium]|nr:hypothetical protein [SAR202 cluster bacterium]|tara:strand:+ start:150 stop:356 length:207 start_codon:yes stop_codon:yes gene_type:complete
MDFDGSNAYPLTNSGGAESHPSWNTSGSQIVFHSDRDGNGEIYRRAADGSFHTNLSQGAYEDGFVSWE